MAPVMAAPGLAAGRSVRIGSQVYPLVLPRLRDSRLHVAGVVITLHTLGQVGLGFHVSVPQILSAILTCFVLQVAITFREKRAFVWPASAMLTGSGIALILRVPSTPVGDHWSFHQWWMFSGIAAFSLLTKFIVRRNGSHVFNPSNVGLVIAFIMLGSSRVEPLDFWWAPLSNPAMVIAYLVILVGGSLITNRLGLLTTVISFWLVLTAGTAINAASGQCFTARWAFAPVCGTNMWLTLITSPEIFIFTYFMITDPRTVPQGRVGRIMFGALVGVVCVMLMAPQETEFGAKVALLAGLTVMTAVRPLVERMVPTAGAEDDRLGVFIRRALNGTSAAAPVTTLVKRTGGITLATVLVVGALAFGARSAQGILASEPENLMGRLATRIDPATFPNISVDDAVINWNHEISVDGARTIVLTLAENLALENQALVERDAALLDAVAHGDRLDAMRERLSNAERSGLTTLDFHTFDDVRVTLLVPFGRQDGLSLGMIATGTVTTEVRDTNGTVVSRTSEPLRTMWALRRATGARWLIVAELPVPDAA
jgi:Na+-transporting NADH:ubiquinone oxidoreductase subunit NqrB